MKNPSTVSAEDRLAAGWVGKMAKGEVEALNALYRLYHRPLLAVFERILRDSGAAEEVLQDTFVRAFENADRFNPDLGVAFAWLVTIGKRIAIDRLRRQRARPAMENWEQPERLGDKIPGGEQKNVHQHLEQQWIHDHLEELPAQKRETLRLVFYSGYTHHEVAELLDRPIGTVKSDLYRGLAQLRKIYLEGND